MLAVKTTCKDRWRQILNEADRIKRKHLLTLQEGVSEEQFREMKDAGVQLVIPTPLIAKFPTSVRPYLETLDRFIAEAKGLNLGTSSAECGPPGLGAEVGIVEGPLAADDPDRGLFRRVLAIRSGRAPRR